MFRIYTNDLMLVILDIVQDVQDVDLSVDHNLYAQMYIWRQCQINIGSIIYLYALAATLRLQSHSRGEAGRQKHTYVYSTIPMLMLWMYPNVDANERLYKIV